MWSTNHIILGVCRARVLRPFLKRWFTVKSRSNDVLNTLRSQVREVGGLALENCETVHNTRCIQRGEGCACDSVDFCPFLQINKISLYLHTNSIAKPPKKIIYREKNNCKKHFSSNSQVPELPLVESRWLGRWIDPPANETSLERDSDSGTKNSARMSCYFRRRSNNVLVSNYSSSAGADGLKNFF